MGLLKSVFAHKKAKLMFVLGVFILYSIYFIILSIISKDWMHPIDQFMKYWYWLIPMGIGFGMQTSLYWYTKHKLDFINTSVKKARNTSLGTSTASMVMCCAHHVFDIVPLLASTALVTVLSRYQNLFFFVGILFNIYGIMMMVKVIDKYKLNR